MVFSNDCLLCLASHQPKKWFTRFLDKLMRKEQKPMSASAEGRIVVGVDNESNQVS